MKGLNVGAWKMSLLVIGYQVNGNLNNHVINKLMSRRLGNPCPFPVTLSPSNFLAVVLNTGKSIAHPKDGFDITRFFGIVFDLCSQIFDMRIDGAFVTFVS